MYAKNEGGVICTQAEEHSTQLINSALDSCMWTASSLSLRAKQKNKWQSTALEREGGIAQLVLRWVAASLGGEDVAHVWHSGGKGSFRAS